MLATLPSAPRSPRSLFASSVSRIAAGILPVESPALTRYQSDPVAYAQDILGVTLTADQQAIALSVLEHRRTAVKAHHSAGKTVCAAILASWWYDCWPEHIVYVTAPTWDQALGLTFKQIKRQRMRYHRPGRILDSGQVLDEGRLEATAHFIRALNAERGEGFQGEHTAPILIIIEEAVGVPPYIFEAADSLMSGAECRTLAIFNPTDEATPAGEMCRSPLVNVLSMSALDHPNVLAQLACLPAPCPGAIDLLWLYEQLSTCCETTDTLSGDAFEFWSLNSVDLALKGLAVHPGSERSLYLPNAVFQGRVLGVFPTQADQQVIPRAWLENLPALDPGEARPEIGCDTARFGDDRTTIVTRRGPCVMCARIVRHMDNLMVAQALREEAALACPADPKSVVMRIDVTGGMGTGSFDILKAEGYQVVPVNASSKPRDVEQYHNRRSEMWFTTRQRVWEKRLDLSRLDRQTRETLIRELSSPKYRADGTGRKVVQPKEEIKKALKASPDVADGMNLAFTDSGRWWEDKELTAWLLARNAKPTEVSAAKQSVENLAAWGIKI